MRCLLIFNFVVAVTFGAHHHGGGRSNIYREQNGWGKYSFGYDIHDPWGNKNFRKEHGEFTKKGGHVVGSYGIYDAKGRLRIVKYTAGKGGFVATIKTNEPGTGHEDSAGAFFNGPDHGKGKWIYDVGTAHHSGKHGWHHGHHGHHGHNTHNAHHGHHGHHNHHNHHGHPKGHKIVAAASEVNTGHLQQRRFDDKGFPVDRSNDFSSGYYKPEFNSPRSEQFSGQNLKKPSFGANFDFDDKKGFNDDNFGGNSKHNFGDNHGQDNEYHRIGKHFQRSEEQQKSFNKPSFNS